MIDWHSHILPEMDDGSRDVAESISLLNMLSQQGADIVAATPHFLANNESVDGFLERRKNAFDQLQTQLPEGAPKIVLGAEVKYYQGISRLPEFEKLRIEGSNLLLLEMSMSRWTEYTVRELVELSGSRKATILLAHVERYWKLQSEETWERLYDSGILMQVNASFFTGIGTRRRALQMLKDGAVQFIGSDCHNVTSRPPNIGKAFEIIEKKLGDDFLNQMNEYGYSVFI